MNETRLTETEVESLADGLALDIGGERGDHLRAAVEAILTARLAKVKVLCDEADEISPLHSMIPLGCVRASEVRAALSGDPGPEEAS